MPDRAENDSAIVRCHARVVPLRTVNERLNQAGSACRTYQSCPRALKVQLLGESVVVAVATAATGLKKCAMAFVAGAQLPVPRSPIDAAGLATIVSLVATKTTI
jgi:hypothetical protein